MCVYCGKKKKLIKKGVSMIHLNKRYLGIILIAGVMVLPANAMEEQPKKQKSLGEFSKLVNQFLISGDENVLKAVFESMQPFPEDRSKLAGHMHVLVSQTKDRIEELNSYEDLEKLKENIIALNNQLEALKLPKVLEALLQFVTNKAEEAKVKKKKLPMPPKTEKERKEPGIIVALPIEKPVKRPPKKPIKKPPLIPFEQFKSRVAKYVLSGELFDEVVQRISDVKQVPEKLDAHLKELYSIFEEKMNEVEEEARLKQLKENLSNIYGAVKEDIEEATSMFERLLQKIKNKELKAKLGAFGPPPVAEEEGQAKKSAGVEPLLHDLKNKLQELKNNLSA